MKALATIEDVMVFATLTEEELVKAEALLPIVSARLRYEAKKVNKDLDEMITNDSDLECVAKSVIVGIVERTLKLQKSDSPIVSQYSESALGYSYSGTIPNPGESLYIKNNELKALGLKRQRYGVIDFYGND
jgi:hypothetical protein